MTESKYPPTNRTFDGKRYRIFGTKRDKMTTSKKEADFWKHNLRSFKVLHRVVRFKMDGVWYYVLYERHEKSRLKKLYRGKSKARTPKNPSVEWLRKHPSAKHFRLYMEKKNSDFEIKNMQVGKLRDDGSRGARWQMRRVRPVAGDWFTASTSYLTDEGYPDRW